MGMIAESKATACVLGAALVCSTITCGLTAAFVGEKKFQVGVESGKGQLKEAMAGEIYELKLVGMKDGKAYELEVSYGYSSYGSPQLVQGNHIPHIPNDAKVGDSVACIHPGKDLEIVSRRP